MRRLWLEMLKAYQVIAWKCIPKRWCIVLHIWNFLMSTVLFFLFSPTHIPIQMIRSLKFIRFINVCDVFEIFQRPFFSFSASISSTLVYTRIDLTHINFALYFFATLNTSFDLKNFTKYFRCVLLWPWFFIDSAKRTIASNRICIRTCPKKDSRGYVVYVCVKCKLVKKKKYPPHTITATSKKIISQRCLETGEFVHKYTMQICAIMIIPLQL